ncbi:DUF6428 family protein [Devosia sp.]|uniref:DUF6428 family protein n=1 Tax=Devosia sp. TaxID=1871048 RepID=UPI0032644BE3
MTAHASVLLPAGFDSSLASVLASLAAHEDKPLVIEYGGRHVQPGYHVTEVKAASFATLDCGGNPDAWQETILQVEDIPAIAGRTFMSVGKFRGILAQVDRKVRLDEDARLTFEIGVPGVPMQVFDVAGVSIDGAHAVIRLGARAAICKPRHRAAQKLETAACCGPSATARSVCCA